MYINYFLIKLKSEKINFKIKKQKIGFLESFRSAPWEAFCLQGASNTNLKHQSPFWSFSVSSVPMCKIQSLWNGTARSVPNLNLCKLPLSSYTPNTSPSRYAESFVIISVHHLCPRCSFLTAWKNPPNPLRGDRSINFSRLNPNLGVHLSTLLWERLSLLDPGSAFPALEPGPAWRPTTPKPHSELYMCLK